jgi:hypothetical protein
MLMLRLTVGSLGLGVEERVCLSGFLPFSVLFVAAAPASPVFSEVVLCCCPGVQTASPSMPISLRIGSTAPCYSHEHHPASS